MMTWLVFGRRTLRCSPALQSFQPAHTSACNIRVKTLPAEQANHEDVMTSTLKPWCLIRQQEELRPGQGKLQISPAHPNPARHSSLHPLPHSSANITPQRGMAKWKHGKFPDKTRKTTVPDILHFQKSHGRFPHWR